jgi:hypothetical protein
MYDASAIAALTGRIGWAAPMAPTSKVLTDENSVGTSGRTFDSFHAMCIVENVEECMPISNANTASVGITNDVLNAYLTKLREQAALKVLNRVFDSNEAANYRDVSCGTRVDISGTDYSSTIIARPGLFTEAYGLQVAYDCLEMFLTSARSNLRQRVAAEGVSLRVEQQGYTDENGKLLWPGVFQKLEAAYARISKALFIPVCNGPKIRDVSHLW